VNDLASIQLCNRRPATCSGGWRLNTRGGKTQPRVVTQGLLYGKLMFVNDAAKSHRTFLVLFLHNESSFILTIWRIGNGVGRNNELSYSTSARLVYGFPLVLGYWLSVFGRANRLGV